MTSENIPKTVRKKTSVWVDAYEWDRFVRNVHDIKSSTCHFIEPYILAVSDSIEKLDSKPIIPASNINLNIDLNVQRVVRRRKKLGEAELKSVYRGDVSHCAECGSTPFYKGSHQSDPFTLVVRYLCVDCFKFSSNNGEIKFWDRLIQSKFSFEGKESRVIEKEIVKEKSRGVSLRVDVKNFKDWIGIKVL